MSLQLRSYLAGQVSQQEYPRLHLSRSQQEAYRQTPPCWALMESNYASYYSFTLVLKATLQHSTYRLHQFKQHLFTATLTLRQRLTSKTADLLS